MVLDETDGFLYETDGLSRDCLGERMKRDKLSKRAKAREAIRAWIVNGDLGPSHAMPGMRELAAKCDCGLSTVYRAVEELVNDGFIRTEDRSGTYLADVLPHKSDIGLIFYEALDQNTGRFQSCYQQRLYEIARLYQDPVFGRIKPYQGVTPLSEFYGEQSRRELHEDVKAHRLGGLVFTTSPGFLVDPFVEHETSIPRIQICGAPTPEYFTIMPEWRDFYKKACERLRQRGRKRVAFVNVAVHDDSSYSEDTTKSVIHIANRNGLQTSESRVLFANSESSYIVRSMILLLLEYPVSMRPDGIVICDDNLLQASLVGADASGLVLGKDFDMISHANLPLPANEKPEGVMRLGFDMRQVLETAIRAAKRIRRHQASLHYGSCAIPAYFEDELAERPEQLDFDVLQKD